jgi:hypothetical protein
VALALVGLLVLTACPKDPYDPQTWIAKLDDPLELKQAVTELQRLKDPVAIEPLGAAWRKHNRDSSILRVIIELAGQPGNEKSAKWDKAIPILIEAVEEFDVGDRRSIEDAAVAAEALGRAGAKEAVPVLVAAANKKMPRLSPGQRVRVSALRALGYFGSDDRAIDTLTKVLAANPEEQPVTLNAAAARALAETGNPKAIQPLLKALYALAPIYQQVRAAVTRIGPPAVPELIKVFKGEHAELNSYASAEGFAVNCAKGEGPNTTCKAPSNLEFKAAALLGDLRAKEALPLLTSGLSRPARVAFYDPQSGAPGPTQHAAILDALRIIGAPDSADAIRKYWADEKTDDAIRPLAIDVYSMVAQKGEGLDLLGKWIKDDEQEEELRRAAALGYARLVTRDAELEPLEYMIKRYRDEAQKKQQEAQKARSDEDKEELKGQAAGYRSFQRLFEQHRARARVGISCSGKDASCLQAFLDKTPDEVVAWLGAGKGDDLKKQDRESFKIAVQERALIDLAKMGRKASAATQTLLKLADTTDGIVRQGILMALAQVADLPCKKCVERLDEIIESQKDQTTLDRLTAETRIAANYFRWAGAQQ